jgi:hypothetical protein
MKKLIVPILAITAFVSLSACKTDVVEKRDPSVRSSTTTTSDESSVQRPVDASTTTETRSSN